jgi:hypothetical protein
VLIAIHATRIRPMSIAAAATVPRERVEVSSRPLQLND